MGHAKRLLEANEAKRRTAMSIAITAGVVKRCEFHENCLFMGGADPESAYKLGNSKFTKNELRDVFDSRQEMTDSIKSAIEEIGLDECARCSKD